jgi:multidrug efflux system membrane fusion protein
VTAVLTLDTIQGATVVPSEAVQPGQQGQFLYVIKADNTVEPRVVTVGRAFGKKLIIEKGVTAGETVVTDGHLRLFPGAQVHLVDASKLDAGQS